MTSPRPAKDVLEDVAKRFRDYADTLTPAEAASLIAHGLESYAFALRACLEGREDYRPERLPSDYYQLAGVVILARRLHTVHGCDHDAADGWAALMTVTWDEWLDAAKRLGRGE